MRSDSNASKRWHLYVVSFSHITSFYAILPMIPYLNIEMGITGLLYALSFSGYYATQLLSYLYFGSISDRIGRRNTLLIALCGLFVCNLFCFTTTNPYTYIILRTISGLFDCVISITQAYVADISNIKNRAACLARLESVVNVGQCIGPLIAGIISNWSVRIAIYFGIGCELVGFLYAVAFLPESLESILERKKLLKTFNMVRRANQRNALNQGLLNDANREVDEIQQQFMSNLKKEEKAKMDSAKFDINYLIIMALICEFCNKFVFSVFDTIVSQYGEVNHQLTSLQFSLLSTVGSAINIFQTASLFHWLVYTKDMTIPHVGCIGGITGVISCIVCIYGNKFFYWVGSILIIVAYGFYAPVAPAIMSAESTEVTQGKALSLTQIGGQLAYIISPLLLEALYSEQQDLPFFITIIPAFLLAIIMFMCPYLPGGKHAGQVSLVASLENEAKLEMMTEDNEYETDYLGSEGIEGESKNGKKRMIRPRPQETHENMYEDYHFENDILPDLSSEIANRSLNTRGSMYGSVNGEDMEI